MKLSDDLKRDIAYGDFTRMSEAFVDMLNAQAGPFAFRFKVVIAADKDTFTLPLLPNQYNPRGTFNFSVDWGDNTADDITTADDDPAMTHTYKLAGTYTISMIGTCTNFDFNGGGDCLKVTEVVDVVDMGFLRLAFTGCSNLTTITENFKKLFTLKNADNMFQGCSSLTTIPAGIYDNCTKIASFGFTFAYSGLTTIPADLFKNNVLAQGFYLIFNSTPITSIPADLFKYNVLMDNIDYAFQYCSQLTAVPAGMLDTNVNLTTCQGMLWECGGVTAIPANLFKFNTLVTTFYGCFAGTGITTMPADLFKFNTLVTSFDTLCSGCIRLTSVPADLFRYNTLVTTFQGVLGGCNLTTVPANFFKYNTVCLDFSNALEVNNSLQLNANIFFANGEESTRFLNQSVNFTACMAQFNTYTGVQGVAPDLWACDFGTGTPNPSGCFIGATIDSVSNVADIPSNWLNF